MVFPAHQVDANHVVALGGHIFQLRRKKRKHDDQEDDFVISARNASDRLSQIGAAPDYHWHK